VHVDHVLERQVTKVEGQRVPAEPLHQLQVVERVGHARCHVGSSTDPGDVAPGKLLWAVEREQGCEPDTVALETWAARWISPEIKKIYIIISYISIYIIYA